MNLRLDLAYDGTGFRGFARQPGVRTVQAELEAAVSRVVRRDIFCTCAGRTDAGVHALAQVVGFSDAPDDIDLFHLPGALNKICGPEISVASARAMPQDWDARSSARSRTYVYALLDGRPPDPFMTATSWYRPTDLDVDAMNEAAGHLIGEHDFTSFGRLTDAAASSTRVLFELTCSREGRLVRVKARANAFIQQMVRSLVGTLVRVGEGRTEPTAIVEMLEARDRAAAGPVAPAHGLALVAVEYDEGWSVPPAR